MSSNKVIVFGPTGNIGSYAARTAQEHGAKVYLAMRDTSKTIRGLSSEDESKGGYERVQADLTQPDTIADAVKKTGAKRAFIYLAHMATNHMKDTIQALKDAGIEFVVFLSSYTIRVPAKEVQPADIIPYLHAQVEVNLEEIYGAGNYVAVRPGGFATNTLQWKGGINAGELKVFCPEARFDYITPIDMGRVSGTILADGKAKDGQKTPVLFGPQMLRQREAVEIIGKALGKDVNVIPVFDNKEGAELYKSAGMPPPLAEYIVERFADVNKGDDASADRERYDGGVANIEKLGGKAPTSFKEFVEDNKDLFTV